MMKSLLLASLLSLPLAIAEEGPYPVDPASQRHNGVPKGTVEKFSMGNSRIYPGTKRSYWIYTPAQYDASKPACLMVFLDGGGYVSENGANKIPIVFDNLIAAKEMPVTIAVFIDPGFKLKEFPTTPRGWQPEPAIAASSMTR